MPSMLRARLSAALLVATTVTVLAAGCAVGPDTGPDIVRGDNPGGDTTEAPKLPDLQVPDHDLNWRSCGDKISKTYDVAVPDGVTVQCATYDVPLDSDGDSTIRIGVMRASTASTPKQAPPLVLTSGTDLPSSRTLLTLAGGDGKAVLDRNPVVAVDFRGTGLGATVDCLTTAQRTVIASNAAGRGRDVGARATEVGTAARAGADLCTETLSPNQLAYSVDAAASDLEGLRDRWGVDRLGLIGVGDGSSIALRYAAAHPDRVGRLVLDSPVGYNIPARESAAARARGVQKSLTAFAQRCANADCALGSDAVATLNRVITAGAGDDLDGLSDKQVLAAITTAIALDDMSPAGLKKLGAAISNADHGDTAALRSYVADAEALRGTDGRLVGRCNDLRGRPGLQELSGLVKDWSNDAAMTAVTAALDLADCDGWGSTDAPAAPESLAVNPLVLVGANDPFNGSAVVDQLTQTLSAAKASPTAVTWDGLGFSVLAHSDCAAGVLSEYLGPDPMKAPTARSCPA
ncbi:alpha/beta hydrolase [Gordonia sp. MP11Mi]|uniref:Alpha/beta fold hydrolase n=1 Tax=Gordonia sp. MP11Mi TaxID=3022769 RepID=A0AA97D059_9ACTN